MENKNINSICEISKLLMLNFRFSQHNYVLINRKFEIYLLTNSCFILHILKQTYVNISCTTSLKLTEAISRYLKLRYLLKFTTNKVL